MFKLQLKGAVIDSLEDRPYALIELKFQQAVRLINDGLSDANGQFVFPEWFAVHIGCRNDDGVFEGFREGQRFASICGQMPVRLAAGLHKPEDQTKNKRSSKVEIHVVFSVNSRRTCSHLTLKHSTKYSSL